MDISLLFKLGALGILVAVITMLLKQTGRDDIALLAAIAGLIIALTMVINVIAELFESLKRIFNLY